MFSRLYANLADQSARPIFSFSASSVVYVIPFTKIPLACLIKEIGLVIDRILGLADIEEFVLKSKKNIPDSSAASARA